MSKKEKISFNKIEYIVNNQKKNDGVLKFPYKDDIIELSVRYSIEFQECALFINNVVENMFITLEDGTVRYSPYNRKVSFLDGLINFYTNIKGGMQVEILNDIVWNSTIYEDILDIASRDQIQYINCCINELVEFKKENILHSQENRLNKALTEIESAVSVFSNIGKKFKDIDPNELMNVYKSIAAKDEKEIVSAVIDNKSNIVDINGVTEK